MIDFLLCVDAVGVATDGSLPEGNGSGMVGVGDDFPSATVPGESFQRGLLANAFSPVCVEEKELVNNKIRGYRHKKEGVAMLSLLKFHTSVCVVPRPILWY